MFLLTTFCLFVTVLEQVKQTDFCFIILLFYHNSVLIKKKLMKMNRPDVIKSSAIVATATANTPSSSRHKVKCFFFYFINYLLTLFHNTALHHRHAKLASTRKQTLCYAHLNESKHGKWCKQILLLLNKLNSPLFLLR